MEKVDKLVIINLGNGLIPADNTNWTKIREDIRAGKEPIIDDECPKAMFKPNTILKKPGRV